MLARVTVGALVLALVGIAGCTPQHHSTTASTPEKSAAPIEPVPTSSGPGEVTGTGQISIGTPPVPSSTLEAEGTPFLVDRHGHGSASLAPIPHRGALSTKISCTSLAKVRVLLAPDVDATVTCGPYPVVLGSPKVTILNRPVTIQADPSVYWAITMAMDYPS